MGLAEADALDVPMWVMRQVGALWRFGMTDGRGDEDFTALIRVVESWAGVEVRSAGAE